jgi:hypothetical protein
MQVEQVIGGVDEGLQLPGAAQFDGIARPEQRVIGPDAL